jgi:hypothetical protein
MKRLYTLITSIVILFCLPILTLADDVAPTSSASFVSDLNSTFVFVLLVVLAVFTLLNGGLLLVLVNINKNPSILRVAEQSYDNARKDTQELLKLFHTSLELAERLAIQVAPLSSLTKQIDLAEDIMEEITDGKPLSMEDDKS